MNTCPVLVQYSEVLCTTRPVTVTAEVAVKRATMKGVNPPPLWVMGKRSSRVPSVISPAKA